MPNGEQTIGIPLREEGGGRLLNPDSSERRASRPESSLGDEKNKKKKKHPKQKKKNQIGDPGLESSHQLNRSESHQRGRRSREAVDARTTRRQQYRRKSLKRQHLQAVVRAVLIGKTKEGRRKTFRANSFGGPVSRLRAFAVKIRVGSPYKGTREKGTF